MGPFKRKKRPTKLKTLLEPQNNNKIYDSATNNGHVNHSIWPQSSIVTNGSWGQSIEHGKELSLPLKIKANDILCS